MSAECFGLLRASVKDVAGKHQYAFAKGPLVPGAGNLVGPQQLQKQVRLAVDIGYRRPAPRLRHTARNPASVTSSIGASTTGDDASSAATVAPVPPVTGRRAARARSDTAR